MNTFDLHMHSIYSQDGEYTIEELIKRVKDANLKTVALSDHNCKDGIEEMIQRGKEEGIEVIPAIEFDTLFEGAEVHVLGYGLDYNQPYFETLPSFITNLNNDALRARIQKISEHFNLDLDFDEMMKHADKKNPFVDLVKNFLHDPRYMNKPEFQPYQEGGSRCEPAVVNFYWDNCCAGTPCYVEVAYPDLQETVERIHNAGGIAIIAHPFRLFYQRPDLIEKAIRLGIDGLEAYSNYHDAEMNAYYEAYAKEHNILMTCGSDFHGKTKPAINLGEYGYLRNDGGKEILDAFLNKLNK